MRPSSEAKRRRSWPPRWGFALRPRVYVRPGLSEPDAARRYLSPAASDLHDPYLLKDMDRAAPRLARAVEQRESILLYGDYDVDGTTAVVVLKKAIDIAGGAPPVMSRTVCATATA